MSMSTPGEIRRPSTTRPSAGAADAGAAGDAGAAKPRDPKATTRGRLPATGAARRSPTGSGVPNRSPGKGRKPPPPVVVARSRNWGVIAMYVAAAVIAVAIVGFGAFQVVNAGNKPSWQAQAAGIDGIINYRQSQPDFVGEENRSHHNGSLSYEMDPPAGGRHNPDWQNCMGDIYSAEVPKEQAIHSLEHGAVWITYRPDLPKDQIDRLGARVAGRSFMFMSPYPGLDAPISLQAWGYQLKVDRADDRRIDEFISALRQNASLEPGSLCSGGITTTGSRPVDLANAE